MSAALSASDFSAFFREVHGVEPFPWQRRLLERLDAGPGWPELLDLPTGTGKTAVLDIAVFHLALEAARGERRQAPVRIAFVVDRRLVVDHTFERAQRLACALASAEPGTVVARVADALRRLAGAGPPLLVRRLRGGLPREEDWARTPVQPTILCSTVDQVGSRLLFRGYGVSDSMKPIHAGLLGSDCLILLDEAHLAEPFRQTLGWIARYRAPPGSDGAIAAPWAFVTLTATAGREEPEDRVFRLEREDREHPVLARRLAAAKPARLVPLGKGEAGTGEGGADRDALEARAKAAVAAVREALDWFRKRGHAAPAIGVVVNRVARARRTFEAVREAWPEEELDALLLIGPQRQVERDRITERLAPIRTGADRSLARQLVIVSTQGIEVGVDIDLDGLITELAPIDSLRQRFGRLNRDGRKIEPFARILVHPADLAKRIDDPIYGASLREVWAFLQERAARGDRRGGREVVDFAIDSFCSQIDVKILAPKPDAPVLLPAHLDLLASTAPVPTPDPPVALFLHGRRRQHDSVSLVWRGDLAEAVLDDAAVRRLLGLVPPRSGEAIELPLWAVRAWLASPIGKLEALADVPSASSEGEDGGGRAEKGRVVRWRGDSEDTRWVESREIRPGDTVVVPSVFGGLDSWGWNPASPDPVAEVAREASEPFNGRRFVVRLAPGAIGPAVDAERLAALLAEYETANWRDLRAALVELPLPEAMREDLEKLDRARGGRVEIDLEVYGRDAEGRPRGVLFVAWRGLADATSSSEEASSEDDLAASLLGVPVELERHLRDVADRAAAWAKALGLASHLARDLELSGLLHDLGKVDPRFQAWLREDDPLGIEFHEVAPLAKAGRRLGHPAAAANLPERWRHEALSVRLALAHPRLAEAADPALVLWLIGTHHGHGRPFFPHADPADENRRGLPSVLGSPAELEAGPGPQASAFDWQGRDWPMLFAELRDRYGLWGLARFEAILRLADHRASQAELAGEDG